MANAVQEKLWLLAQTEAEEYGEKPEHIFGEISLFLKIPPVDMGFYPTPISTSTFASNSQLIVGKRRWTV